jgi:repressor LexA
LQGTDSERENRRKSKEKNIDFCCFVFYYGERSYTKKAGIMKKITERQEDLLKMVARYIEKKGYAPTYSEIAEELGIKSKSAVMNHINALVEKGYLEKGSSARSLRIIKPEFQPSYSSDVHVPLVGRVAAGYPILSDENVERYIPIPRAMIKSEGRYFALKVRGDSMVDAGIFDEDMVVVQSAKTANPKEIVVALINDEVTVKRLMDRSGRKYLKAENSRYDDIYPEGAWSIQGKVVGLIREFN